MALRATAQLRIVPDDEEAARRLRGILFGMPHFERTKKCSHFNASSEEM
jgi:hypothetical protein